jgi:excinuclease ABC subunit C
MSESRWLPLVTQKLESLPAKPGCYLFRDEQAKILYIGKAKSLRSRVRSYFQEGSSDTRVFVPLLRSLIADLDTVVVGTEKEAAILENNLIKEYKPRFNIKLRDDKEFLSLRLDTQKEWPRLDVVRKSRLTDQARYFGPYPSASSARRALHLVNKHFQLRTCTDSEFAARKRPCLQYQINRCPAPCVIDIDREHYEQQVKAVTLFLEGKHEELEQELRERMTAASQDMSYELAAVYRDQIRAVQNVTEGQRLVGEKDIDQDVIGLFREAELVEISVLMIRSGRMRDTASFSFTRVEIEDDEVIGGLLRQLYGEQEEGHGLVPDEIIVPCLPEGVEGVEEWLSEVRGKKVQVVWPQRGRKVKLLAMAQENAEHSFQEKRRESDDIVARLAKLQARLRLPNLPRRIECIDISHLGGEDTVGAVVSMTDGKLDKKNYKIFHVKQVSGGDDYGAIYEVLSRRFQRGLKAADAQSSEEKAPPSATKWELPDLLVVDGGKGQLKVALTAARDLGLKNVAFVGLAKEREKEDGEQVVDRVFLPGQKNSIPLRNQSAALFFLARLRDEAHRFSNHHRKKLGKTRRFQSQLDNIPGVSERLKKELLKTFGSLAGVKKASDAELLAVSGVGRHVLHQMRSYWKSLSTEEAQTPPEQALPANEVVTAAMVDNKDGDLG